MPVNMKIVWAADPIVFGLTEKRMPVFLSKVGAEYVRDVQMTMRAAPRGGDNLNSRGQRRSAPGEPPAPEFGDLIRECRFQVRRTPYGWIVEAGNTLKKSVYLEFGAARGRVMQARNDAGAFIKGKTMSWVLYPRPVWGPAMLRLRAKLPELMARYLGSKK